MKKDQKSKVRDHIGKTIKIASLILIVTILFLISCVFLSYYVLKSEDYIYITLKDYFTLPILLDHYTFTNIFLDFDRQLGDFRYNLLYAFFIAGIALYFKPKIEITEDSIKNKSNKKIVILASIAVLYFVFINIASILNIGFSWDNLNGRIIIIFDLYDDYFTSKLIPITLFMIGGGFPYLFLREKCKIDYDPNVYGKIYLIIALTLINLFLIIYPIKIEYLIQNPTLIGILLNLILGSVSSSIIILIQMRNYRDFKDSDNNKINFAKIRKTYLLSLLLSILFLLGIGALFIINEPFTSLNPCWILLAIPNFIVITILSILFYKMGIYFQISKIKKDGGIIDA